MLGHLELTPLEPRKVGSPWWVSRWTESLWSFNDSHTCHSIFLALLVNTAPLGEVKTMPSDAVDRLPGLVPPDPQKSHSLGRIVKMIWEVDGSC